VSDPCRPYDRPNLFERLLNRAIGVLVRVGVGPPDMRVLEVRGRTSGRLYRLPVDLLTDRGRIYLVAPRGHTQWVRNVEASGEVTLRRGTRVQHYRIRALPDVEKAPILKAYLDRFRREVQRYFPVPAGSPVDRFGPLVSRYPAYELLAEPATARDPA
jgi:deazaflavin-dependent oxidoreductase (nitroreductase family)